MSEVLNNSDVILVGGSWLSISMASCLNLSLSPGSYIQGCCAAPFLSLYTKNNLFCACKGDSCIKVSRNCGVT